MRGDRYATTLPRRQQIDRITQYRSLLFTLGYRGFGARELSARYRLAYVCTPRAIRDHRRRKRFVRVLGDDPAFAGGSPNGTGQITLNTQHPVWTSSAAVNKRKIAIHELFHVHQGEYGFLPVSESFPRWFIEGSAEYIGYQGIAAQGLVPFATARRCMMFSVAHNVDPSLTLRAGGIPPSNGYWLAFMGIDYMSNSDARMFARIYNQSGGSWDSKLMGATGTSADSFFDSFETARRSWSVPATYECPR